jgi:cell shape-determining protein MreD
MEMAYVVNMLVDVILCAICGDYLLLFALMFGYFVLNLHQFRRHSGGVRKDFYRKRCY